MEKPSLEEVKEYFKNAAVVKSVYNTNGVYSDKNIHIDNEGYFCETEKKVCLAIWNKQYGYAKILTYKNTEPKFEITKDQILELYNRGNPQPLIRKMFPNVFDYKLQIGKWYKRPHNKALFCIVSENENGGVMVYGFDVSGNWMKSKNNNIVQTFKDYEVEATNEDVFEALKNEAVKRYKVGDYLKNHQGVWKLEDFDIVYSKKYNEGIYNRQGSGKWLCLNGKWAEVCETISKEDAEKIIGKIIL